MLGAELEDELGLEDELDADEDAAEVDEAELPVDLLHAAVMTPTVMATAATLPTRDARGDMVKSLLCNDDGR